MVARTEGRTSGSSRGCARSCGARHAAPSSPTPPVRRQPELHCTNADVRRCSTASTTACRCCSSTKPASRPDGLPASATMAPFLDESRIDRRARPWPPSTRARPCGPWPRPGPRCGEAVDLAAEARDRAGGRRRAAAVGAGRLARRVGGRRATSSSCWPSRVRRCRSACGATCRCPAGSGRSTSSSRCPCRAAPRAARAGRRGGPPGRGAAHRRCRRLPARRRRGPGARGAHRRRPWAARTSRTALWSLLAPVLLGAGTPGHRRRRRPGAGRDRRPARRGGRARAARRSESFVNPAKVLAADLAEGVPVVLGDGPLNGVAACRAAVDAGPHRPGPGDVGRAARRRRPGGRLLRRALHATPGRSAGMAAGRRRHLRRPLPRRRPAPRLRLLAPPRRRSRRSRRGRLARWPTPSPAPPGTRACGSARHSTARATR